METVILAAVVLLAVWWFGLHRPAQSVANSLNSLAKAGEYKAVQVEANVLKELASTNMPTNEEIKAASEKLVALRELDL